MVCYNPKIAFYTETKKIDEETGEIKPTREIHLIDDYTAGKADFDALKSTRIIIPCGKCEGCQVDKANDWATRCSIEASQWPVNCFVTLTYNNEKISKNRSLKKEDLQKFFKRLRFHEQGKKEWINPTNGQTEKPIRYMACGEYGPRTLRPHYHAAIFNWKPNDLKFYKENETGDMLFTSEKLNKIWGLGYTIIGNLNYESAAYVARYVQKKAYGLDKEWNLKHGREPEFLLTSRRPGLGIEAFINTEQWEKIQRNGGILQKTKTGVKLKKIPQYLKNKWKDQNREEYFQWADKKNENQKKGKRERLKNTSKGFWEQLGTQTEIAKTRLKKLKRLDN